MKIANKPFFMIPMAVAGPIAPAAGHPAGALTGRVVYMSAGHGWVIAMLKKQTARHG